MKIRQGKMSRKQERQTFVPPRLERRRVSYNRHMKLLRMAVSISTCVPATAQGKELAIKELHRRRDTMKRITPVDNSMVPWGDAKYYYCIACGWPYAVTKETPNVPDELCRECHSLKILGWLYV